MKTGLVLEGGALRGIFSCGVCDALLSGGIMADYVVGVSAGIANGVSYISRQFGRSLEVVTRYANDKRYMGFQNLADRENRSYFGLKFAYETIPNKLIPFDYEAFAAYPGQVEAVVTNVDTGRAEYLDVPRKDKKNLVVQASCAIPLMFPIYRINDQPYMDGGVADPIPWERALNQGCDRVIVVLTRTRDYRKKQDKLFYVCQKKYQNYPNFIKSMAQRPKHYNSCRKRLFEMERQGKILVIAPESTMGVSRTERDTDKLRLLWGEGYQMTVDRMEEIKAFLKG